VTRSIAITARRRRSLIECARRRLFASCKRATFLKEHGPKIEASLEFLQAGGESVLITAPDAF
jgi:carbamate kinase